MVVRDEHEGGAEASAEIGELAPSSWSGPSRSDNGSSIKKTEDAGRWRGQVNALLLTSRELRRPAIEQVVQADQADDFAHQRSRCAAATRRPRRGTDVLGDGQVRMSG